MECFVCGLAPCDLPDGVTKDDVFETGDDGVTRCRACAHSGLVITITTEES